MIVTAGGPPAVLVAWMLFQVLLFLAGAALLLVWAFRTWRPSPVAPVDSREAALSVLRHRLANGEIDPEDFEARRRLLSVEESK